MIVVDNFLNKSEYDTLYNHIIGLTTTQQFPWFFNSQKVVGSNIDYNFQFVHIVLENGKIDSPVTFEVLKPLLNKLKPKGLIRIKLNLTTKTNNIIKYPLHRDINVKDEKDINQLKKDDYKVAIFYMNSNNGYTYFENKKKVKSVANRLLKFDNIMNHSGTTCTDENQRVVININYEV
tara:strand:- start:609 stop:1142 length:534 start_codon:yes stop_codon:yes gene_type:complete